MNSAVQRKNMVDSQVRPNDVTDRRIPRAMLDTPREPFVPEDRRAIAYMDGNLPVSATGRCLLAPRTLAKMLQMLVIEPTSTILDVAPASGYSTAVIARIAKRVVAVESDAAMAATASEALKALGVANAEIHVGALADGFPARGPYDGILVGGTVSEVPQSLLDQLKDGGRLVAILDVNGVGKVYEWRRYAMSFDRRSVFDAEAPVLPGFERVTAFAL